MGIVVNRTRLNPFPVKSASGEFISIDDAVNRPIKKLEISFTPNQEGSGDPSVGGTNYFPSDFVWSSDTTIIYTPINVGDGEFTMSTLNFPYNETQDVFFLAGNVGSGASSGTNGVGKGHPITVTSVNGYVTVANRYNTNREQPSQYAWFIQTSDAVQNIRPIHGYTGLKFNRTRKNLLNWNNIVTISSKTYMGITYEYSDGIATVTGTATNNAAIALDNGGSSAYYTGIYVKENGTFLPSGTYKCSFPCIYGTNIDHGSSASGNGRASAGGNISLPNGGYFRPYTSHSTGAIVDFSRAIMVCKAEDYSDNPELYNGETIPVSWQTEAGEVFGGTLDLLTGVLTADWTLITFSGTESWQSYGSGSSRYFRHELGAYRKVVVSGKGLCSTYPWYDITGTNTGVGFRVISSSGFNADLINIRPDNVSGMTATTFKGMLADWYANGTPCTVAYKMKNPVTYQLDSHQISTLIGSNRIWTDVGTISLDYRAMRHAPLGNGLLGGMLGNPVPTEPEEPEEPAEETEE